MTLAVGADAGRVENIDYTDCSDARLTARVFGLRTEQSAQDMLERFGGLLPTCHAAPDQLLTCPDIGQHRVAALLAFPELARRYFQQSLPAGVAIRSPIDTELYLKAQLRHLDYELFCCMFLDNRHRVLQFRELFRGTIDGTSVYPRELVKEALSVNAAAVILAHNHPSGVAEPSQADEQITKRLKAALELLDIRLLDHLIIGAGKATSMASRGLF